MALISEKNFLFILVIRNQDCSFLLLSIHQYSHRMRKAHMAHILRLFYCRHRIQYLLVHETAFFGVGIYREVTHTERGEVLEEMGALARVDVVVPSKYVNKL